jgi:hypothetical protein
MTLIGVYNPNSRMKDYGKVGITMPAQPLSTVSKIYNLELNIKAVEGLRAWKFMTDQLPEAKLHAIRLGNMRSELRQLKAG